MDGCALSPKCRSFCYDVIAYILVFVAIYGYMFICMGLDLTEMLDYYGAALDTYTTQDRWGHAAYRLFFGIGTGVWSAGICTALYLAVNFALQLRLLGLSSLMQKLVFGGFSLACTQLMLMMTCMHHVDALAFAFLLTTLSVTIMRRGQWHLGLRLALAIGLMAFSLGCYQTNLFYALALVLGIELKQQLDNPARKIPWNSLILTLCMLVAATGLWYAVRIVTVPLASEEARSFGEEYQKSRSQLGAFVSLDLKMKLIYLVYYSKQMVLTAFGSLEEGRWVYSTALVPLIYLSAIVWMRLRGIARWAALLAIASIWVLPFAIIVVLGTAPPARTFLAEPLSLSLLWAIAWTHAPRLHGNEIVRRVALALLSLLLILAVYRVSEYERYRVHHYQLVAHDLQQMEQHRIALSHAEGKDLRVLLVPMNEGQYDSGSLMGPYKVIHRLSYFDVPTSEEQVVGASESLADLPYWPAVGSVKREGDILMIKYHSPSRRAIPTDLVL